MLILYLNCCQCFNVYLKNDLNVASTKQQQENEIKSEEDDNKEEYNVNINNNNYNGYNDANVHCCGLETSSPVCSIDPSSSLVRGFFSWNQAESYFTLSHTQSHFWIRRLSCSPSLAVSVAWKLLLNPQVYACRCLLVIIMSLSLLPCFIMSS